MNQKTREEIALFRYSLIAPLITNTFTQPTQNAYLEEICAKTFNVPYYGSKRFAPKTLKSWLYTHSKHGIQGLYPQNRSDKGTSRVLNEDVKQFIIDAKLQNPKRSAKSIYQELLAKKLISYERVSLSTIQRFIYKKRLSAPKLNSKDRRAFEMEYPNDCWQSDASVGPYLLIDGKKQKTYLIAFLDDCSRVITHAEFFFQDNLTSLETSFKKAVAKRGIPKKLFVDNGKTFRSRQFQLICANLGTILCYAQPYSPESKGKIERFFGTLKKQWMNLLDWDKIASLDELNMLLSEYLEKDYHQNVHSSIKMKPIDRFIQNIDNLKFVNSSQELNFIFLHRVTRKVRKDATISLDSTQFEVPQTFIDEQVNVRFHSDSKEKAYLFNDDDKIITTIYPVKKVDNSRIYRDHNNNPIDFSSFNPTE